VGILPTKKGLKKIIIVKKLFFILQFTVGILPTEKGLKKIIIVKKLFFYFIVYCGYFTHKKRSKKIIKNFIKKEFNRFFYFIFYLSKGFFPKFVRVLKFRNKYILLS
jgi:hypothetical protein